LTAELWPDWLDPTPSWACFGQALASWANVAPLLRRLDDDAEHYLGLAESFEAFDQKPSLRINSIGWYSHRPVTQVIARYVIAAVVPTLISLVRVRTSLSASTLAVVRRESGSWAWPAFMFAYQTAMAYVAALVVYQGGRFLGFGG